MSLLGWVVGAALLDEWEHREEEEREKEELRQKNWENERRIRDLETRLGRIEESRFAPWERKRCCSLVWPAGVEPAFSA